MEMLDLINYFRNKCEIIIYNKGQPIKDISNCVIINKPNVGREANTYLEHIISNYDNLSEYTIFVQDDVHNHIPNIQKFYDLCNLNIKKNKDFYHYPASFRSNGIVHTRTIYNGKHHIYDIKKFCNNFEIQVPEKYTTNTCSIFMCKKSLIQKYPKNTYINMNNLLKKLDKENGDGYTGQIFELCWNIIFA